MEASVKHTVGHLDWSFADSPPAPTATAGGLVRQRFIGRPEGAVHTDLSAIVLHPGGWLAAHVHSYEEALYILEGEMLFLIGGRVFRVTKGDYTLMPTGMRHGLANTGSVPVRFISLNSPQKGDPGSDRADTYFEAPPDVAAWEAVAERPTFGDPTLRFIGHYDGTGPQREALAVRDPARGRAPAGADTAILAYSGISVKMLVDRTFGADHTTMFTVDYEIGGSAQQHDHPFEEAYVFLAGEVEGELDGQTYTFRPGDWAFAPVGSVHGFYNTGTQHVRWLETQAPQPPARNSYRWVASWERYAERLKAR